MTDLPNSDPPKMATPPQAIELPAPEGSVQYAEVYDDGVLVGWVWMTLDPDTRPRAGILLAPGQFSEGFQDEFGMATLNYSRTSASDAVEWIGRLAESYTGTGGRLGVGNEGTAPSLEALRARQL